jgi:uncharacterized protein (DUF58 family)
MRLTARGWGIVSSVSLVATLATLLSEEWLIVMSATMLVAPLVAAVVLVVPQLSMEYLLEVESGAHAPGPIRAVVEATPKGRWARSRSMTVFVDSHPQGAHHLSIPTRPIRIELLMATMPRGLHVLGPVEETFHDPFGLVRRKRVRPERMEFLVWPEIVDLVALGTPTDVLEATAVAVAQGSDDFSSIRPYSPGDDPRRIHWRSSARRAMLHVRELVDTQHPVMTLVLAGTMDPAEFETAVSSLASLYSALSSVGVGVALQVVENDGVLSLPDVLDGSEVLDGLALLAVERLSGDADELSTLLRKVQRPLLICDSETLTSVERLVGAAVAIGARGYGSLEDPRFSYVEQLTDLPAATHAVLDGFLAHRRPGRRSGEL